MENKKVTRSSAIARDRAMRLVSVQKLLVRHRSSRNLARLYKMGLLTAQIVKKIEFPKSKMADGGHFENR